MDAPESRNGMELTKGSNIRRDHAQPATSSSERSSKHVGSTEGSELPDKSSIGKPQDQQLWRTRSRRFSLVLSRHGAEQDRPHHQSSTQMDTEEVKRERERGKKAGDRIEPQAKVVGFGHTSAVGEEWYFHRLTGSDDAVIEVNTSRERNSSTLASHTTLASVMTHRYAASGVTRGSNFSSSSLLPTPGPQSLPSRSSLSRSLSSPYFHSWSIGNIDLSHQVC
jgi:hypothetical protein